MNKLFCIFGDFYASETQDKEVTKSLLYKEFTATLTEQACSIKNLLLHMFTGILKDHNKTMAFAVMKQHSQGLLSLGYWLNGSLTCCLRAFALIAGFCYPLYSHISLAQTNCSICLKWSSFDFIAAAE